ncbi:anhydro-N-acetylmuramic acid kinase [Pasteurella skyensis]|uniref:Anhydro-N-acetylmuramic acid kinase n=1 Tax=Phocoenobacter skyensis TaxID=97481 RepID=A0AAJ6P071_9PAST|nr:anhydro-N-acetylmuramic acid kinase [Pasteurella skyensis]MDP8162299.1 anhydro-N-acetylmuramic acid kinase [Pasteurella skyensis]MDP8172367.1 anhydro-N-acetylmuramic acid kinase [Pasteurella skyensis]MDP8177000.1 anhydro-N-acetylmuramic acid kinase [Pasteurella skyensis]MDP8178622.1 anhydro-N-acetylmuramic acid kinase [Pasteurella skyensis]MDP8182624.1 anhydro-N-acetylmuramic acid kinase [Pasteurella skyensis]
MQPKYYIGVMSGTSLDGVDLALVDFSTSQPVLKASHFVTMPEELRQSLLTLCLKGETSLQQLGELDHRLGVLYADAINQFLSLNHLKAEQIEAVGCHGQTVWHSPQTAYPFTTQIGDANIIAAKTGITTVADFRRKDMAFGGQGAPLVPAFHQAVFFDSKFATVVLNIGGISNISVLIPDQAVIGYDTGVGNLLLDAWIGKHFSKSYDKNGEWAKTGQVNQSLLAILLDEPFFKQPPPKSTGREQFNLQWLEQKIANFEQHHTACLPQDIQRTLVEFTVQSTVQELLKLETKSLPCRLLVCGGGAKNPLIMQGFKELLPQWNVSTTTNCDLDIDYVEAVAFAWLAYQRIHNLPSNMPSVTGATKAVSLGVIYPK